MSTRAGYQDCGCYIPYYHDSEKARITCKRHADLDQKIKDARHEMDVAERNYRSFNSEHTYIIYHNRADEVRRLKEKHWLLYDNAGLVTARRKLPKPAWQAMCILSAIGILLNSYGVFNRFTIISLAALIMASIAFIGASLVLASWND